MVKELKEDVTENLKINKQDGWSQLKELPELERLVKSSFVNIGNIGKY